MPFTVALMESFVELNLAPSSWMQLCRACLSGGDCYGEATTLHNLDVLTGAEQHEGLAAQIAFDPAVYAQIAAVEMWKVLPNKGAGEQLSKILQGPSRTLPCYSWEVTFLGMWTQLCLS